MLLDKGDYGDDVDSDAGTRTKARTECYGKGQGPVCVKSEKLEKNLAVLLTHSSFD